MSRNKTYLGNTQCAPLVLPQKLQGALGRVMVILGDGLKHGLGKLHMTVFVYTVGIADDDSQVSSYFLLPAGVT